MSARTEAALSVFNGASGTFSVVAEIDRQRLGALALRQIWRQGVRQRGVTPLQCLIATAFLWWSQAGSNRRPLECHSSALPTELWPLAGKARDIRPRTIVGSRKTWDVTVGAA